MLTVILSSFNEVHNEVFWANLRLLAAFPAIEVVAIDGGSQDGTKERMGSLRLETLPNSQRGERYNLGIRLAAGDLILLVHPRSLLPREGLEYLLRERPPRKWGAFRHTFDWSHPLLKFTSWYSNFVRGRFFAIFYLDHCLFFSAELKAVAHFPAVSIFEDTYFCRALRAQGKPLLLPYRVVTSAVRFRKNGIFRQSLLNQILKLLFHLGVSEKWMNRIYERGLSLNSRS